MIIKNKSYQDKIEKNHRRNFIFNIASSSTNDIGSNLIGQKTILPAFMTMLTHSNLIIGMLPAIHIFFWTTPQLLTAYYTNHLKKKKKAVILLRIGKGLPWLLFSIFMLSFIKEPSTKVLLPFFIMIIIFALQGGFTIPLWTSFFSKLTFPNIRGRFLAFRQTISIIVGILASFKIKEILIEYQYPVNFSIIFITASILFLMSALFLTMTVEPDNPIQENKKTFPQYFNHLKDTARNDKILKWFIVSTIIRSFGGMAMGGAFYTVYAINKMQVDINQVGTFMGIVLSTRLIGATILGYINDVKNPKFVQIINRLFEVLSILTILIFPDIVGVYIAFGLLGLAMSSMNISYHNTIIELAPKEKIDTYMGLVNGFRAPSIALSPLIGGFLIDHFSFQLVFIIAAFSSIISCIVLIYKVHLHEHAHYKHESYNSDSGGI
jgi:predicted MFS family arabinose efflux permease